MPAALNQSYRRLAQQVATYIVVGGINTVLSVGLLWLLYRSGLPYPVYTTLAYVIMILVSFELNRRFTFTATRFSRTQYRRWLMRFCLLHLANLAMIQVIQATLIERLHVPQYAAVVFAALSGMVTCFIGSKLIFEAGRSTRPAEGESAS
jgi:putative flippase GtrA